MEEREKEERTANTKRKEKEGKKKHWSMNEEWRKDGVRRVNRKSVEE